MSMLFKRIKDWAVSIISFRTGDVIPVDGPNGTAKMSKDNLLKETAQNALAGNLAPAFDPTKPNDEGGYAYYAGTTVTYEGKNYVFSVNHSSGAWKPSEVEQKPLSESINLEGVGEAVQQWLNAHPEATTTVQDHSLTLEKFTSMLTEQTQNIEVTPEMYGAVGDGRADDTSAFAAAIEQASLVNRVVVKGHTGKRYKIKNLVVRNATIKNCVFLPVQADEDNGILLRSQSVIEDCFFSSFKKAISIDENCVNSFVLHNIIQYSKTGIYINVVGNNSANSIKIIGNYIIHSGATQSEEPPVEEGCGIYANGKFCGLFITYNIIELSRKHGITLYNNESVIVSAVVSCNCFEQNYGIAVHINMRRQNIAMVSVTGNFFSNYAAAGVSVQNFGVVFDAGYSTYPVVDNVGRCFASFQYSDYTYKSCVSGSHYYRFDSTSLFTPTTSEFYSVQAKVEKPHVAGVTRYVRIKYYASLASTFSLIEYSATVRHTFEQGFNDVVIPFVPQWRFNRALVDDEFLIIYDYSLVN